MKKRCLTVFALIALLVFTRGPSWAGSDEKLINKLVEKNILTRSEATELIQQMQAEEAKGKKEVAGTGDAKVIKIPDWVENTKVTGDFRARYQTEDTENDHSNSSRNRERLRFRLGVETAVNDQWKAGFGLASGSSDPRSTNQTLEDTFSKKSINLDYAYAQYTPVKWASLLLGKFKNPLFSPDQLMWDSDIRPEGAALILKYEATKNVELFANLDAFILEEFSNKANDPYMIAFQPGVNFKLPGDMYFKIAGSYYNFNFVKGNDWTKNGAWGLGNSKNANSQNAAGNWLYDYSSFAGDAEFGLTKIPGPVPYAALYGQYVRTTDSHANDTGWLAGLRFGHKDVNDFGQWKLSYNYRRLEKDAWPDFLPDSDAYGGSTNIKGHKAEFLFGISKNVSLGLNYYFDVEHIQRTANDAQNLFQADINLKF